MADVSRHASVTLYAMVAIPDARYEYELECLRDIQLPVYSHELELSGLLAVRILAFPLYIPPRAVGTPDPALLCLCFVVNGVFRAC